MGVGTPAPKKRRPRGRAGLGDTFFRLSPFSAEWDEVRRVPWVILLLARRSVLLVLGVNEILTA
jgi:hypothetical protein